MNFQEFWEDKEKSQAKVAQVAALKGKIIPIRELGARIADLDVLVEMAMEEGDESALEEVRGEVNSIRAALDEVELQTLLNGPHDSENAFLTLHAGAGGTEACDWTDMLMRMYQRWGQQQGFKVGMVDVQEGEEVGIRGATLRFEGANAYGYLNCERGVHRLVRISPFDSQARRHTSFAGVEVMPEIDDSFELHIDPNDLRVDVYRSSGPGGQSVNTTDSAVRVVYKSGTPDEIMVNVVSPGSIASEALVGWAASVGVDGNEAVAVASTMIEGTQASLAEIFELDRSRKLAQIERFGGNISRTAEFVGMERSALHRKIKSLGM